MIKIEIFINEISLDEQYNTQEEFENALKIIKDIFESINSIQKENIDRKIYYTNVLWDCTVIKNILFKESFNKIKQKDFKIAIRNIMFNKVNPKDWQTEKIHLEQDHFDYFDGKNYKDAKNTSLAEVTERQLINSDSKYLLINFIDSSFQDLHPEILECSYISVVKNNEITIPIKLDSADKRIGLEKWLEKSCRLSKYKYNYESAVNPPTDTQTILRDNNKFERTQGQYDGRTIYKEKETGYLWYVDNLHYGKATHLEVFDKTGDNHIGESDLEGNIDKAKSDNKKTLKNSNI
jgi:hypothetical protein